jgi:hypothetical protein
MSQCLMPCVIYFREALVSRRINRKERIPGSASVRRADSIDAPDELWIIGYHLVGSNADYVALIGNMWSAVARLCVMVQKDRPYF